jgi:hypothetical protein
MQEESMTAKNFPSKAKKEIERISIAEMVP